MSGNLNFVKREPFTVFFSLRGDVQKMGRPKKKREASETDDHHEDHCESCNDGGNLLCCDNCDFTFHFTCAQPPLLPEQAISDSEPWYCRQCGYNLRKQNGAKPSPNLFGALFDLSDSLNPHVFVLPPAIRRQTNAELNRTRDAKELEFTDLMKNPERCLDRYAADETVDYRKRKGVRIPHSTFSSPFRFLISPSKPWKRDTNQFFISIRPSNPLNMAKSSLKVLENTRNSPNMGESRGINTKNTKRKFQKTKERN